MIRYKSVFMATLTLGTAVVALGADVLSDFKAYLKMMEPKVIKAFETEDLEFFNKISTPDFKTKEGKVVMNKQQSMAQMKQMFAMSSNMKGSFKMVSCQARGTEGTVVTDANFRFDMTTPDGKTHKATMSQRMTEKYRKTPKGWMICMIVNHPGGKMTMDGKPFDPSSMGGPPPTPAKPVKASG